jgi:hypothetical protein
MLEYACRVALPIKKDGSQRFCGNYCPLNSQTKQDSFLMPLIEDVLMQLGKSSWFFTFDLQSRFGQINMVDEDIYKIVV